MTSSLNIDFSNISFGTFQTIEQVKQQNEAKQTKQAKSTIQVQQTELTNYTQKSTPNYETSYSTLSDYIKQIETNKISKDLQTMIDKYNNSDVQLALQTIKQKLDLIQKQEQAKDVLVVYADTAAVQSSFNFPNTVLNDYKYHCIFLNNNEQWIIQNINKYNFTEHNYTNNSRLFFDIDYDPPKTIKKYEDKGKTITVEDCYKELIKLFELIHDLQDKYNLIAYGIIEYNPTLFDVNDINNNLITSFNETDDIHLFSNNHPEFHKVLSGHIYLNGYTDRYSIMNYMTYLYHSYKFELDIFDTSVYKTKKQSFRMSYSPKVDIAKHTVRPLADDLIPYITQHSELLTQIRMTPHQLDKQITIEDYKQNEDYKQLKSKIEKKTKTFSSGSKPKTISILQYIFYNPEQEQNEEQEEKEEQEQEEENEEENEEQEQQEQQQTQAIVISSNNECTLTNIKDVNAKTTDHFDMTQKLNLFKALPLSYDEFKTEFDNIEGINEKRKEDIFNKLQYHQDFKADIILYTYKKHINKYFDDFKKFKKPTLEQITKYTDLSKILTKIKFYIDKYAKKCFINHTFYDVKTDINYIDFSKEMKILNNCCKFVSTGYIYYPYLNKTFNSINQFKTYFGMNGQKANTIFECLTAFEDEQEFKLKSLKSNIDNFNLKIEKKFNKLTKQQQQELFNKVDILLSYLRKTFKYDEDYKFYLSYYHTKLNKMTTINKGLINQGTLATSAKDSLKTLFNDLLSDYIKVIKADIANINKSLNGGYFENELLVIEELPQTINEIDNFILKLKENTSVEKITVEKKGLNPYNKQNDNDIIINTNFTVKNIVYNKNNCETILKRFKIMTRQSLNMNDKQLNYILDEFKQSKDKALLKYCLYKYIKDNTSKQDYISIRYFNYYKEQLNHIEQIYMDSAVSTNTTERIETHSNLNEWIKDFKENYLDKNNVLRLKAFTDYLIYQKIFKEMKTQTLKQLLTTLLLEDKTSGIKLNGKGSLVFTNAKQEDYEKIYNQFYQYVEIEKTEEPKLKTEEGQKEGSHSDQREEQPKINIDNIDI